MWPTFAVPERDEAIKHRCRAHRTAHGQRRQRIANGEPFTAEKSPVKLIDRVYSDIVNPLFYKCFVKDSKFYVKDSCISCGKCARECPTHSISIENGRPVWGRALHAWHGLHMRLPCGGDRVRQGEHRQAVLSLPGGSRMNQGLPAELLFPPVGFAVFIPRSSKAALFRRWRNPVPARSRRGGARTYSG